MTIRQRARVRGDPTASKELVEQFVSIFTGSISATTTRSPLAE